MIIFEGPTAVAAYQATALASAIRFYAETGMTVNRDATPKAMMAQASRLTGKPYKARAYASAIADLKALADRLADEARQAGHIRM